VLAAAIDYINDRRLRTLAPLKVETSADIFTSGITVDPTYGEFEEELRRRDESAQRVDELKDAIPKSSLSSPDLTVTARVTSPERSFDKALVMKPGGRRLSVGRVADNDLQLEHPSVSKIHAALVLNREGTLLVADTGSTNGTFINGRRISYGEARHIEEGDVVGFGDVEVRFKRP
jgi:pSer/pThr/pTyr-binding forkhead associated (FHA) protein